VSTIEIYRERIHSTDPRCRRHILHDSRAWDYRFPTADLTVASVEHVRTLPILDQGQVGSCTAECGTGLMGTEPYYSDLVVAAFTKAFGSFGQPGAYSLYSVEETLDGDGPYPPNDNGSTGLTLAKALRAAGLISGWTQTFSLTDALKALTLYPLAVGTYWFNNMFTTTAEGIVKPNKASGVAGGHEYEAVGYDATRGLVKFANSWGTSWGWQGYFYMAAEDFGALLADQGDVTVMTPMLQPAPVPTPPAPPAARPQDVALAAAMRHNDWVDKRHTGDNRVMAQASAVWLAATGL